MTNCMLNIHAYILLKVKDKIFQIRQIVKHCIQDIKNIYLNETYCHHQSSLKYIYIYIYIFLE